MRGFLLADDSYGSKGRRFLERQAAVADVPKRKGRVRSLAETWRRAQQDQGRGSSDQQYSTARGGCIDKGAEFLVYGKSVAQ